MPPIVPAEIEAVLTLSKKVAELEKIAANAKLLDEALLTCRQIVPKPFLHPFSKIVVDPSKARVYKFGQHAIVEGFRPKMGVLGSLQDYEKFIEATDGTRIMARRGADVLFAPDGTIAAFVGRTARTQKYDGVALHSFDGVEPAFGVRYKQLLNEAGINKVHRWEPGYAPPPPPQPCSVFKNEWKIPDRPARLAGELPHEPPRPKSVSFNSEPRMRPATRVTPAGEVPPEPPKPRSVLPDAESSKSLNAEKSATELLPTTGGYKSPAGPLAPRVAPRVVPRFL